MQFLKVSENYAAFFGTSPGGESIHCTMSPLCVILYKLFESIIQQFFACPLK